MTAAELIQDIHRHGGDITIDGDDLNLTATQPLPADLLHKLRTCKAELLDYLSSNAPTTIAEPDNACPACGAGQWWQLPGQAWHCRRCESGMPLSATTLTLPCHAPKAPPVPPPAGLGRMLGTACLRLSITPAQLRQALIDDLAHLASGELTEQGLRKVAETLSACLPPEPGIEKRELSRMLADNPGITYAMTGDTELEPDGVSVTLAIRDTATCELRIPKDRYDGLAKLEMIEEQTSESYAAT